MAGEAQLAIPSLPATAYFVVQNATGQFWNTSGTPAFEAYNASNWTSYDVALTQQGSSAHYLGTFPSAIPVGVYTLTAYAQAGGSPAITDSLVGSSSQYQWTGAARQAFPSNFSTLGINSSGHVSRVVLVDTTTTNSDMRGTDNAALAATALSTATWTGTLATNLGTLASHDPGTTLGTSTLTQAQVTGGAYALNSASFAFNAAMDFTTTQKAATLARVTLVDTTTANTDMRGTDNAALATDLATVAGYLDTEIAAIKSKTDNLPADPADQSGVEAAITAATSGLATSSALSALVTTVGAAGAGLTEAGGTGDQLTAVPWNAAWDAEVQSEVADALTAFDFSGKAVGDVSGKVLGGGSGTITGTGVRAVDSSGNAIPTAAQIDTQLSGTHGAGSWLSGAGASAADIANELADRPIVLQSPTTSNGQLDLMQGVDYYTDDGREIEFTFQRAYVPDSCKLTIACGAIVTVTSTDIEQSSGSGSGRFNVRFTLPRATGDDLEAGAGSFEVISVVGSREVGEVAEGVATIRRRLTA